MNREILFRGKRIDNGKWEYGTPGSQNNKAYINYDGRLYAAIEVHPSTVGQFTGLTDKNGKRIFEGDKVEWMDCVFVIMWDDDNCCYYGKPDPNNELRGRLSAFTFLNSTVIGTIHDNPEKQ